MFWLYNFTLSPGLTHGSLQMNIASVVPVTPESKDYVDASPALSEMSRQTHVNIAASYVSPQNVQIVEDPSRAQWAACRLICCCQPCYKSKPSTPGPFACERRGCPNTHGNWDVEAQRKDWGGESDSAGVIGPDGLPGIGWSGFCSYNCALQTYFNINYEMCCISEGVKPPTDGVEECAGCANCCIASCCVRQMYDPADDMLQKAGWDVEAGGLHLCCYTASPNWTTTTESLEPAGVNQLVTKMAIRAFTPEQVANVNQYPDEFDTQLYLKQVIANKVLASEQLYDKAYSDHVRDTAASFATLGGNSVKPLQNVSTIFELYAQARVTEPTLKLFLTNEGGDSNKMNGGHCATSIKGIRRAMTKIKLSYGENVLALTDVCRGSLMFASIDALGNALKWMIDHPEVVQVLRIKNRFLEGKAAPGGYRDVLVNCRFPTDPHRHVFEVQLHLQTYHDLKKGGGGHKVYKIARFMDAVMNPVSTYNLNNSIKEAALNEMDTAMFQRIQLFANGDVCQSVYTVYESEFVGSIRGEKDVTNVMACLLGVCIGGAIQQEIENNNMKNILVGMVIEPPCPPIEVRDKTKDNRKNIRQKKMVVEGGLLSLCCMMHNELKPLFVAGMNNKDHDLKAMLLEQWQEDWMYCDHILQLMGGELASLLDGDASGSTTLGEMKGVNSLFCLSMCTEYNKMQEKQKRRTEKIARIEALNKLPVLDFIAGNIHVPQQQSEETKEIDCFEFETNEQNSAKVTLLFDEVFDSFIKHEGIDNWEKESFQGPNRFGASICIDTRDGDGSSSEISKQKIHVSPKVWCGTEYFDEKFQQFETESRRGEAMDTCLVPVVIALPTEPGRYEMTLVKDANLGPEHMSWPENLIPTRANWTKIISTKINFVVDLAAVLKMEG